MPSFGIFGSKKKSKSTLNLSGKPWYVSTTQPGFNDDIYYFSLIIFQHSHDTLLMTHTDQETTGGEMVRERPAARAWRQRVTTER